MDRLLVEKYMHKNFDKTVWDVKNCSETTRKKQIWELVKFKVIKYLVIM